MPTEQQLKTLDRYVNAIHELLLDQIHGARTRGNRQLQLSRMIFIRMLGQILYEAPKLHTGMVSIRLIEQKLKNFSTKACLEHHHSRQKGGTALINLIDQAVSLGVDPTKDQIYKIVIQHCQVHYTTVEENAMLRKHQRKCSSEAAYRRSNIQLIEARDLFTHKGRHPEAWKQRMREKYQPAVDLYNNPTYVDIVVDRPLVIN